MRYAEYALRKYTAAWVKKKVTSMKSKSVKGSAREGQGLVEYVLILLLIAVICVTAVSYFGRRTANKMPTLNELEDSGSQDTPERTDG
jgi:hypothetical protein